MELFTESWNDYELIDAGGGRKLERWGKLITIRPEVQAYFHSGLPFSDWSKMAHWEFIEKKGKKGVWKQLIKDAPRSQTISYGRLKFHIELTKFKHLGLFPEQRKNWDYINENVNSDHRFLNLFAYTGAASCAARNRGADTIHVDSVKPMITWAKKNMELSRLLNIRWVHEDALKFLNREVKRGNKFQSIIMDPPAWGIGAKGERWKLEDQIDALMSASAGVLSEDGFLILNTYSPIIESDTLKEMTSMYFPDRKSQVNQLKMNTKTSKNLYFGELVRVEKKNKEAPNL
ncbi:MAG: class I SAM-dependent methyltransferase [Crocinitomicaceae bacterium]|jgi:23S rRNA (cytosine1962-C5)-methyltransferase|nr:class I SAM-dependent methyltransferase [Crocinitomicaceae bacterium]